MTSFIVESISDQRALALWLEQTPSSKDGQPHYTCVRVYGERDQYPLAPDRYVSNRPNIFLDIIDALDGNPVQADVGVSSAAHSLIETYVHGQARARDEITGTVSLKALCQKAAHSAADGSGNARRFKDARALWQTISDRVLTRALQPDSDAIVDVRRTHNWKRNQPYALHPADPAAWYVTRVYSRSNVQKNAITVFAGLDALLTAIQHEDAHTADEVARIQDSIQSQCVYPAYRQIASLLDDSNMLVFHHTESLIEWIRQEMKAQNVLYTQTPCNIRVQADAVPARVLSIVTAAKHHAALSIVDKAQHDDETELTDGVEMTAGHCANVLEAYLA